MTDPKYVIIRSYSAGVFTGLLMKRLKNRRVLLNECRRIHYWEGAASLSQLAMEGVKKPKECRFSVVTNDHEIEEVIEVIPCTEQAINNIKAVPEWKV